MKLVKGATITFNKYSTRGHDNLSLMMSLKCDNYRKPEAETKIPIYLINMITSGNLIKERADAFVKAFQKYYLSLGVEGAVSFLQVHPPKKPIQDLVRDEELTDRD